MGDPTERHLKERGRNTGEKIPVVHLEYIDLVASKWFYYSYKFVGILRLTVSYVISNRIFSRN